MKIIILGGKGYLGWPMSIDLALAGNQTIIIDNLIKSRMSKAVNVQPLFSNSSSNKLKIFNSQCNNKIISHNVDCCKYIHLSKIIRQTKPDAIIHFAEQASAPYSMKDYKSSHLTVHNNIISTLNVLHAIKEFSPNTHLIKLGTMGEYGTPNIDIEEGWITIKHKKRKDKFLYPREASSLYHTSKILDTDLVWFYVRNYNLRVTDLMQGPVYGFETKAMRSNTKLFTNLYYDTVFGTVINRFIVQACCNEPLTIYGRGEQTRGYINLKDTIQCISLALKNKAKKGKLEIYNQFTESLTVNQIADKVINAAKKLNIKANVRHIKNPRKEKEIHHYNIRNTSLKRLGLRPNLLTQKSIVDMMTHILNHIGKKTIKINNSYVKWT